MLILPSLGSLGWGLEIGQKPRLFSHSSGNVTTAVINIQMSPGPKDTLQEPFAHSEVPPKAVNELLPGYWGPPDWLVHRTEVNTTFDHKPTYIDCYCIRNHPCSCSYITDTVYLENLSPLKSAIKDNGDHVMMIVNGTLGSVSLANRPAPVYLVPLCGLLITALLG